MNKPNNRHISHDTHEILEKFFGELELAVMEVVWEKEHTTVSEVLAELNSEERSRAYTTIMTIMTRLCEKGWLTANKEGRAYVYSPTASRTEVEARLAGNIIRTLLVDFGQTAIVQFARELEQIDPEQLARLLDMAESEDSSDAS
jgi:predicted transcriptional regulator